MKKLNQNDPAVSVILPVYNCEAFIKSSVESILNQSFKDFELIVINDGSTDFSGEILRDILKKDSRIKLIERENKGLIYTLNEGIAISRGRYIARMDADDIAMPDRLELQYLRLNTDRDIAVLGSAVLAINANGGSLGFCCHFITPEEINRFCEEDCPLIHPTVMMRKEVVVNVGGYRSAYQYCEDYDLWLRIIDEGYKIANLAKPLLCYRIHTSNISTIHQEKQRFNAVVARLSHRMRITGLTDPTVGRDKIDSTILELFPAKIKQDLDSLFFTVQNTDISSKVMSDIQLAWLDYKRLTDRKFAKHELSRFLIRLMYGALKNKKYLFALKIIWEAAHTAPVSFTGRLLLRVKIFFRVRYAQLELKLL